MQNVIVCTLCSCTAFSIIGLPPDWYKDLEYRARVVRESRTVLREMGLDLPPEVEIRVWDTTADTRYMVLPERPPGTLAGRKRSSPGLTRDTMIGVARRGPRPAWTGCTTWAAGRASAACVTRSTLRRSTPLGEVRANALYCTRGALRNLQHGRVPPRDRAHGASALSRRRAITSAR